MFDPDKIKICSYDNYQSLRNINSGCNDNTLVIKRCRRFRVSYSNGDAREYFIDDFCHAYEHVYGKVVQSYSNKIVDVLNEKYGDCFNIYSKLASDSQLESFSWDDDEDDEIYRTTEYAYVMVLHLYFIELKEGVDKNLFKIKYPELSSLNLFEESEDGNSEKIKVWFNTYLKNCKDTTNEQDIISEEKSKIGFVTRPYF